MQDTIQVRRGEELPVDALQMYLQKNLPNYVDAPLTIEQFSEGHSNLTYVLTIGGQQYVLRRPPLGPVAAKAHDMAREYKILQALHPIFPVAPKPILFSNDESIIGSPFFIMERKKGIVLDTDFPEGILGTEADGRRLSQLMVDYLVQLHALDYEATELVKLAKPDGFLSRQVHSWIDRYDKVKTSEIEAVAKLTDWLKNNIPASPDPAIIHYDFKFNNAMFNEEMTEFVGLFDWEMTTVGDPLADVGVVLSYWIQADDPKAVQFMLGKPPITTKPGFFTRAEFIQAYATQSGRDLSAINYYLTFAYFKLAVIGQQIYYRYVKGQTTDARFAQMDQLVSAVITHASENIE